MRIIIDIPKEAYNLLQNDGVDWVRTEHILDRVAKGILLDDLRAEIMDTGAYEQEINGKTEFLKGINYCLGVIDRYKAESEDKE